MADPCPGLEDILRKLLPRLQGVRAELTERGVEISTERHEPRVLANVLEVGIENALNRRRY